MDNSNQSLGQNLNTSVNLAPEPQAPVVPMATDPVASQIPSMPESQPVQPQGQGGTTPGGDSGSSKRLLWIAIIFIVLALVGFAGWYYYSMNQINNSAVTGYTNTQIATPTPTPTPSTDQVTPIQNSSDLNGALNQVDSSSTSAIQQDLNQNTSDSTGFSQ